MGFNRTGYKLLVLTLYPKQQIILHVTRSQQNEKGTWLTIAGKQTALPSNLYVSLKDCWRNEAKNRHYLLRVFELTIVSQVEKN